MDPSRLTQKSQEAVQHAQAVALRHGHPETDGEHLLAALLDQPEGLVPRLLARLDVDVAALRDAVEAERQAIRRVQQLRAELEQARRQVEEAERRYDLGRAAELRYGTLAELRRRLAAEEEKLAAKQGEHALLREVVGEEEIAEIVSLWTGIPISRLRESEREKLLRLDDVLHERVVGQDEAVRVVSDAILRARSGIKDPRRPIGSFVFLGPTGVGKTELARALAAALFDAQDNLVRLDMSEYQERHTVSRLVGAPPGYVGYEEGGQLTEAVRRKPYSVVLFTPLNQAQIEQIVELMLGDLRARLAERRMTLEVTDTARRFLAAQGFDPVYGARPLRRFIAREVETRIARALLTDALPDGSVIRVDLKDDEPTVTHSEPAMAPSTAA